MQRTPNLGLPQFEPSDKYRLEDYNEAYMKIDEKVKELKDKEAQLDTKLAEAQSIIDTWETFKNTGGVINGSVTSSGDWASYGCKDSSGTNIWYTYSVPNDDSLIKAYLDEEHFYYSPREFSPVWNSSDKALGSEVSRWSNIYLKGSSLHTNGYTKLPNGLLLQWGKSTSWNGGKLWIEYPISFPSNVVNVSITSLENVNSNCKTIFSTPDVSNTGFNAVSNVNQIGFFWIAIGY